jgi:hypothetical protein
MRTWGTATTTGKSLCGNKLSTCSAPTATPSCSCEAGKVANKGDHGARGASVAGVVNTRARTRSKHTCATGKPKRAAVATVPHVACGGWGFVREHSRHDSVYQPSARDTRDENMFRTRDRSEEPVFSFGQYNPTPLSRDIRMRKNSHQRQRTSGSESKRGEECVCIAAADVADESRCACTCEFFMDVRGMKM